MMKVCCWADLQWCLRRTIQNSWWHPAQCVTTWSGTHSVTRESFSSTCSQLRSDAAALATPAEAGSLLSLDAWQSRTHSHVTAETRALKPLRRTVLPPSELNQLTAVIGCLAITRTHSHVTAVKRQEATRGLIYKTLIVNISGTDQAIDKRITALWSAIFSTFGENNSVNFGPLTKKWLWPWNSIGF